MGHELVRSNKWNWSQTLEFVDRYRNEVSHTTGHAPPTLHSSQFLEFLFSPSLDLCHIFLHKIFWPHLHARMPHLSFDRYSHCPSLHLLWDSCHRRSRDHRNPVENTPVSNQAHSPCITKAMQKRTWHITKAVRKPTDAVDAEEKEHRTYLTAQNGCSMLATFRGMRLLGGVRKLASG